MKLLALVVGMFIMGGTVWWTFLLGTPHELGFEGSRGFPAASALLTAVLMLLGLIFGCLFRRMAGRKEEVNIMSELKSVMRSSSFLSALCVSPFVFMSVYAVVKGTPGDPASMLLAFQNGFFCESVFAKMFPSQAPVAE